MNLKSKLWYFWGSMDVLALLLYSVNSLRQDRIPFISDLIAFTGTSDVVSGGGYYFIVTLFFIFDLLLLLSLFISAWLFFKKKDVAIKFALIQEVFRLISFRCSVSFFPLLVSVFGISSVWVNLGLFVISELLKVYSLVYLMGKRKRTHSL
ncbi:TPA: hypothetical protein QHL18_000276 [Enterobacter hormaechei subsp. steigerwaltii]|jgi:hypothetical protein|uniref:Uncharacterized protein n=2 Tax=Enterobacter hormaechei TaxID=158836 RepID=A0AAE4J3S9_9ENTR|nr:MULTISPECIES: hypothetical protein [Enterobacter]AVE75421.1 hypothetical protein AM439_24850 [Enterobacter cloacae complex sp.]QLV54557.1 hypothetical protein HV223_09165 [Enterobacter cloacae]AKZ84598.1 hypothetical protein LI65_013515 [Enterobacter hormaechei subsp. steigerwaltii]AVF15567.1 hypothetical protein AM451_02585 [Enterobacter cloacae complex sp.]AWV75906.1 hypothetical protein DN066_11065 [Enterobacter hormaechei subsp. xiangfangensis]